MSGLPPRQRSARSAVQALWQTRAGAASRRVGLLSPPLLQRKRGRLGRRRVVVSSARRIQLAQNPQGIRRFAYLGAGEPESISSVIGPAPEDCSSAG